MNDTDDLPRVPDDELDFDANQVFYHDGLVFTGVSYDDEPDGTRAEITYRDGVQHGPSRAWWLNGQLKEEDNYIDGLCHGVSRTFTQDGRLTMHEIHEYAILTSRTAYGPDGEITEQWQISPSDQWFTDLQDERRRRNWPSPTAP